VHRVFGFTIVAASRFYLAHAVSLSMDLSYRTPIGERERLS
jgi:hypothetical protein